MRRGFPFAMMRGVKGKQENTPVGMIPAGPDRQKRFKILDWGANPNYNNAPVTVGQRLVSEAAKPTYAFRLAPLDYEHNTEPTSEAYRATSEPRLIAGYGIVEVIAGDGVYMTMILWTAEPDGWAAAHTYADVSANPVCDPKTGEVFAIKSVALVRTGATDKHFIDVPLGAAVATPNKGKTKMDWKALLIKALGLADTATDDEISAALTKALTPAAPQAAKKPDGTAAPCAAPLAAQIADAVNAAVTPLAAQFKTLSEASHRRDVDAALERARNEGKAVPLSAETAYSMPLAAVADIIGKTPVTVPLSARTPQHVAEPGVTAGPTEAERDVARACGMDPEAVFGKK